MTSNVQDKIDPEELAAAVHEDAQDSPGKMLMQSVTDILAQSAQSVKALVSGHAMSATSNENGEEKPTLQSMGEITQSTQLVQDAVGGSSDGSTPENEEEKTLYQAVGERIAQTAQSMKEAVTGSTENEEEKTLYQAVGERIAQSAQSMKEAVTGSTENEEEKTLYQAVGERIAQSAQSMKEAVTGGTETGEEKTVLQAVGEKIVQSAKTVKDAVKGDVRIIPGEDETAEHSILVHTILD